MRKSFNRENIGNVRGGPGVYKLYEKNAKKPTYIGETNNLPRRLMEHKNAERYHSFEVEHTASHGEAIRKEKRLIRRHEPRRNIAYA